MDKEKQKPKLKVIEGGRKSDEFREKVQTEEGLKKQLLERAKKIIDIATEAVNVFKNGNFDKGKKMLEDAEANFNEFKKEHQGQKNLIRKIDNAIATAKRIIHSTDIV